MVADPALQALRASATETNNLADAFRRAIEECRIDSTTQITFSVEERAREIHPVVRDEIYRVGYEAIRNACLHSSANGIDVTLEYGHDLTLRISDNGVGIDAAVIETGKEGHFGLRGMRERRTYWCKVHAGERSRDRNCLTLVVPGRTAFRSA